MTQINENIKIVDAKVFFPKSRPVLRRYGIEDLEIEDATLKRACEIHHIDVGRLLADLLQCEEEFLFESKEAVSH